MTSYAAQGYDAGLIIGSALKATGGKIDDMDAVRAAMRKADFKSVRGAFKFGANHHPIQDWYSMQAEKLPSGQYGLKTQKKVLADRGDDYTVDCKM